MKTKIIIASWLISLMLMATDNHIQALIGICWFTISSLMLERNKIEIDKSIKNFEKKIDRIINKQK